MFVEHEEYIAEQLRDLVWAISAKRGHACASDYWVGYENKVFSLYPDAECSCGAVERSWEEKEYDALVLKLNEFAKQLDKFAKADQFMWEIDGDEEKYSKRYQQSMSAWAFQRSAKLLREIIPAPFTPPEVVISD